MCFWILSKPPAVLMDAAKILQIVRSRSTEQVRLSLLSEGETLEK